MPTRQHNKLWGYFLLQFVVLGLLGFALTARALDLTPEQIAQFQALSPTQQQALAQQLGINLDQLQSIGATSQPQVQPIQVVKPLKTSAPQASFGAHATSGPLESLGTTGITSQKASTLQPFGYNLFAGQPTTFAPVTEIPVPTDYVLGPGDHIQIQLFGNQNKTLDLQVNRDGTIQFPQVGPVSVAGLKFEDAKRQLHRMIKNKFIGVEANINLGKLRSMQVFVLGDARTPGSYTVSSLSTITNALYVSGGIAPGGSLRHIELKRHGKLVGELDLYQLLQNGDDSQDRRLQPGDVIFIPPEGPTVAVDGQVKRPAIYELKGKGSLKDVIRLAGGLTADAYPVDIKVNRVGSDFQREVLDVNYTTAKGKSLGMKDGDQVHVSSVNDLVSGYVRLKGDVFRPGDYDWHAGMRVSEILSSVQNDLKKNADLDYALLVRQIDQKRDIEAIPFNLGNAITEPGTAQDPILKDRDKLLVFASDQSRKQLLKPVIDRLMTQVAPGDPPRVVDIQGAVRHPGQYPLPTGAYSVKSLIVAAGGLLDSSYLFTAEVIRNTLDKRENSVTNIFDVDLQQALRQPGTVQKLMPRDVLLVKRIADYGHKRKVTIGGEVRFPGTYNITKGETLSHVIQRAGGLTENAFPRGAIFTRVSIQKLEAQRLQQSREKLKADLASLELSQQSSGNNSKTASGLASLKGLLAQAQHVKPTGRLVINLPEILKDPKQHDLTLRDGDSLFVPQQPQSVAVIGEVQFATSHLYNPNLTVQNYIDKSGGETDNANGDKVYVVRADGSVWLPDQSKWFGSSDGKVEAGDTIVVPLKIYRVDNMKILADSSQIFYQIALGAVAVGRL